MADIIDNISLVINQKILHIFGPFNNLWVCMVDIADMFGYKNPDFIKRTVSPDNKKILKDLVQQYSPNLEVNHFQNKMAYVNIVGLQEILSKSRSNDAKIYGKELLDMMLSIQNNEYELKDRKLIKKQNNSEEDEIKEPEEIKEEEQNISLTGAFINETKTEDKKVAETIFDLINRAFLFEDKQVRTMIVNEDIWFCGSDIAKILGYQNSDKATRMHVDDDDKLTLKEILDKISMPPIPSGVYKIDEKFNKRDLTMIYINESGLYSLIIKSKLPVAKQFKKYITSELLPSIRKLGQEKYINELKQQLLLKEEEIKNKEAENKWLYQAALKKVSFEKRTHPKGFIYTGYHKSEENSQIKKMGQTGRATDIREMEHSSSSSDLNAFNMKSYFQSYMSEATEYWLQKLMDPLQVKTDNPDSIDDKTRDKIKRRKKKEHFMINQDILEFIIKRVLNCESEIITFINKYIELLEEYNKDFDKIDTISEKFIQDFEMNMKTTYDANNNSYLSDEEDEEYKEIHFLKDVKKCSGSNGCGIYLPLNCFEIKGEHYKSICINCVNSKCWLKCRQCDKSKIGNEYKVNENGIRLRRCNDCLLNGAVIHRTCRGPKSCGKTKPNSLFGAYASGRKKKRCLECETGISIK